MLLVKSCLNLDTPHLTLSIKAIDNFLTVFIQQYRVAGL
jgi:hypothetical protein